MKGLLTKYFVLKPQAKTFQDDPYAMASRRAMRAYAESIKKEDPQLTADLERWVEEEFERALLLPERSKK